MEGELVIPNIVLI